MLMLQVRDDHLCEERGERFTQEILRESLITPIKKCWLACERAESSKNGSSADGEARAFIWVAHTQFSL